MRAKAEHNNLSKASKQKSLNLFIHVQHNFVLFECTQICICIYTYAFIYLCVCWCFYFLFFYRRTALERVWVGRTNNQASQVTHTHTLWAQCGCVLHTDTPYFLAQDCVKPQGEGHQTEKHRRQINWVFGEWIPGEIQNVKMWELLHAAAFIVHW